MKNARKRQQKRLPYGSLFVLTLCDLERHKAKISQQLKLFLQSNCASSSQRNNAQSNSNVYKVNRTGSGVAFVVVFATDGGVVFANIQFDVRNNNALDFLGVVLPACIMPV